MSKQRQPDHQRTRANGSKSPTEKGSEFDPPGPEDAIAPDPHLKPALRSAADPPSAGPGTGIPLQRQTTENRHVGRRGNQIHRGNCS